MSDSGSIQLIRRLGAVLDCFAEERARLRAVDIRDATGLPMTTVARIVQTLVAEDLLQRQGDVYSIGLRVLAWSAAAHSGSELLTAAGPPAAELRDVTGESCGVWVRRGAMRVSVLQEHSRQSIVYRGTVGAVLPLHAGAAGKIFLAFDPAALSEALDGPLEAFTAHTTTDRSALDADLQRIRRQGWAFTREEREQGLNSMAAPVHGPSGAVVAAIAIGGPSFRLTTSAARQWAPVVTEQAAAVSRGLLWSDERPPAKP